MMDGNGYIEPTEEQEEKAKQAVSEPFSGGIRDTSKYVGSNGLFKNFRDTANRYHRTDKGTKWQNYIDANIADPEAKRDMERQIAAVLKNNPNQNGKALKFRLRAIEANIRRRFPNSVPKNFDISGAMLDRTMAKTLLKMPKQSYGEQQQAPQAQKLPATQSKPSVQQAPQAPKQQSQLPKAPGYVDNAMHGNTHTQQARQRTPQQQQAQQAPQQQSGANKSWSQPLVDKVVDKFNDAKQRKAEQSQDLTSQNAGDPYNPNNPIYQQVLKDKVIADLEKKILQCKAIMKKYPNDKNIQAAQQKWIDTYNKAIKKREFKIRLVQNSARNGI